MEPLASNTNKHSAEGFLGSIFKYSISTFANIGILGVSMLITLAFIPSDVLGQISIFTNGTNTIMTIAILGLDQSLIRFYFEPPKGLSPNGLFRICFYFSSAVLLVAGILGSTVLLGPIYSALNFTMIGPFAVPLLFLNAFFYMVARYFNVLYRMEGNIKLYTAESILMQFFYKLFYVVGNFLGYENPVPAMAICSLVGLGCFALVFSFIRRDTLRPRRAEFTKAAYREVLPYGLAVAPTAVMVTLNGFYSGVYLNGQLDESAAGIYSMAFTLSNIVTMVQGGFASFWGPYMFENHATQQVRIKRVHNYLNLVIVCFFALLVAFEDIIFLLFPQYRDVQPIFPLMMLSAVFTILCETTVYGNAIARRPIYDTIGIGLSFVTNVVFLLVLTPFFGLLGAAVALALANLLMFLFRTYTGQRLYSSIQTPGKTALCIFAAVLLAVLGTVFAAVFWAKLVASLLCAAAACLLYRDELARLVSLAVSTAKNLFSSQK